MERKESIGLIEAAMKMLLGPDNKPISDLYYALETAVRCLKVDEMYGLSYEDADWYDKAIKENERLKKELEMLKFDRDCISREATKQAIRDFFPNLDDRCEINSVINMQPTVYPKSDKPSGEWIYDGHHLRCSNCNDYHAIKDSDWTLIASNYCPNCGAKMVEPQESEDT